jgi:hypothetical protein
MATEDQIIKKLAELKLADTPANRKIAIEALTDTGDKKISEMTQEEVAAFFGSAGQQSGTNYLSGYEFPSRIVKGSKRKVLLLIRKILKLLAAVVLAVELFIEARCWLTKTVSLPAHNTTLAR